MAGLQLDLARFLLASSRFAPVLLVPALTPFAWVPLFVRTALLVAVASLAVPAAAMQVGVAGLDQPIGFGVELAGESVFGLCLALAVVLPGAAIGFSARVVDIQSGVSAINLLNPSSRSAESMAGTVMQWALTLAFFALGFHLLLVRGLIASTRMVPLGTAGLAIGPDRFLALLGSQFVLGLAVVAPVILGLFAVDVAVAFASRSMPQANVYFVALPLKVAAGFVLLAATLRFAPALVGRVFEHAFSTISSGLKA